MQQYRFLFLLGLLAMAATRPTALASPMDADRGLADTQQVLAADTLPDPESHLTLDKLAGLPMGKSVAALARFFDEQKVYYVKLGNGNVTLKNFDLDHFLVDGVAYTFSQFDFTDINREVLERVALIKDGKYTTGNPRALRNQEKIDYEVLAKSINEKLRTKYGPPQNGYYNCGPNAKCMAVVGTAKTYEGDDIIALYLTVERR